MSATNFILFLIIAPLYYETQNYYRRPHYYFFSTGLSLSRPPPTNKHHDKNNALQLGTEITRLQVQPVPIVHRSDFDPHKHYYHTHTSSSVNHDGEDNGNAVYKHEYEYETPVLVTNALSSQQCETACDGIVRELGETLVNLQRKTRTRTRTANNDDNTSTNTNIIECELQEAFGYIMESHHDDSFFVFCEGLLDTINDEHGNVCLEDIRQLLKQTKEHLLFPETDTDTRDIEDDKQDLFDYFPLETKPSDCVIVAGEGATSTLHRDPFTWTGTSICLEGTKIWRFVAPPEAMKCISHSNEEKKEFKLCSDSGVHLVDDALKSYRLPSVAWGGTTEEEDGSGGDGETYISSGWQSDLSLYITRDGTLPSAEQLASLDEENPNEKQSILQAMASSLEQLSPGVNFPPSLNDDKDEIESAMTVWTVVQNPGDMLIIPAFWWHQTYAPEPSVAIASQAGGSGRDVRRIVSHIIETLGLDDSDDNDIVSIPSVLRDLLNDNNDNCAMRQKDVANSLFRLISDVYEAKQEV